jgi:hypothetical protein
VAGIVLVTWVTLGATALFGLPQKLWHHPPPPIRISVALGSNTVTEATLMMIPDRHRAASAFKGLKNVAIGFEGAVTRAGGAYVGLTDLQLTLEGRSADPVSIDDVRAVILERRRAVHGALALIDGGGDTPPIPIRFDLDAARPEALTVTGEHWPGRPGRRFFTHGHKINIAKGEIVTLDIAASTRSHFVVWVVEIDVHIGAKAESFIARDEGRAFRTTANIGGFSPVHELTYYNGRPHIVSRRTLLRG